MSQNQQKYDYEFIKEEYNKAERVLSDIVSILKSSFDKKYILKNEDKYIQKVIAMLIDIRKIESDIKGIYFDAENDKLEEPYKGLQEIKENVKVLKWYYDRVNLLIKSYNKLYPGTIKAADKDEDIANKCYDIKLTLKKIAVEISKMIQKSKNEINEINKASDPETHTQKTKDTLDLLQKKIDKLEKDQVEVNGHIDNMKEAKSVLTKQMKITDIAVIHRYFKLLTLQEYYDAVECIEVHKQYLENGRTQKENSSASDGTTKNAGDNSNGSFSLIV